jgi:hypothetical protein
MFVSENRLAQFFEPLEPSIADRLLAFASKFDMHGAPDGDGVAFRLSGVIPFDAPDCAELLAELIVQVERPDLLEKGGAK